jgi:hypothetical protein
VTGDAPPGPSPVGLLFRHVLEERARTLFPPRSRVLDIPREAAEPGALFDGAYAAPGALDGVDLQALGRALAAALRPGAPVLLCLRLRPPGAQSPGPRESQDHLGPAFVWHRVFGLGILVPGEARQEWVRRHPQAFGVLAALEGVVRRWPLLRGAGDYAVLEGARR